ncbi:MAG: hypothetical protein ACFFCF_09515 [Promethearchaeota archaeon]
MAPDLITDMFDDAVRRYVKLRTLRVYPLSGDQTDPLEEGQNYWLVIPLKSDGPDDDFLIKRIQVRVVGNPNQIDFYSDGTCSEILPRDDRGKPRVHLSFPIEDVPWIEKQVYYSPVRAYLKANRTIAQSDLEFNIGVYAYFVPRGGYWFTENP